jgi:hypothetical protein
LRIGPFLLAAVVLGASALHESFAADKASNADHAGAKVGKANAPRNLLGRGTLSPGASERVGPNAIGVSASHHEGVPGRDSGPHGIGSAVQFPMPADVGRSATGIAKGSGHIDSPTRPQLHTTPMVNPAALNRSAINGTTLIRPGFRPSGVGGPAKAGAIKWHRDPPKALIADTREVADFIPTSRVTATLDTQLCKPVSVRYRTGLGRAETEIGKW